MVQIKRAYEPAQKQDGYRVLVDRLWPRGLTKADLHLNDWLREISPSSALRKYFGHDPEKWTEFKKLYTKELKESKEAQKALGDLAAIARKKTLTLVYGAKDPDHNNALVLLNLIQKRITS